MGLHQNIILKIEHHIKFHHNRFSLNLPKLLFIEGLVYSEFEFNKFISLQIIFGLKIYIQS
jgi:hypothetical protein